MERPYKISGTPVHSSKACCYDRADDLGVNDSAAIFKGIAAVLGSCDRS